MNETNNTVTRLNSTVTSSILANAANIEKNNGKIAQLQQGLHETQRYFKAFSQQMNKKVQSQEHQAAAPQLNLIEARHWIQLAWERLVYAHDLNGAISLLEMASKNISELQDSNAAALRQALAQDLMTLRNFRFPDIDATWVILGAMIQQVQNLPARGYKELQISEEQVGERSGKQTGKQSGEQSGKQSEEHANEANTEENPEKKDKKESSFRTAFNESLIRMKDIIKIQHHTKPIEPILSQEDEFLAKAHLKLILEQARSALLQANEPIYQQSLKEAKAWLSDYFETSNDKIRNMVAEISKLQEICLTVTVPTLQSLALVQQTSVQQTQISTQQMSEQQTSAQQMSGEQKSEQQQPSDHQMTGH